MTIEAEGAPRRAAYRPTPTIAGSIGLHCAAAGATLIEAQLWPWTLGAVAGNHALLTVLGLWPRSTLLGPNITRLPPPAVARGEIALTFDDGPDPEVTPRVLDLLERHGAHGSFFCIAERAAQHAQVCREIVRRGHGLENHSTRHSHLFAFHGLGGFRAEISAAQSMLMEASGRLPRFFRAPAGLRNPLLDPVLHGLGLRLVSWTRRGFDTGSADAARVAARLTQRLAAGDILLLHDGSSGRSADGVPVVLGSLERVLETARDRGLRPVPLHHAIDQ